MKFKVGDHVVGNKKSWYSITKQGWRGEVVEVISENIIRVKALPGHEGGVTKFPVTAECFDLIDPTAVRKIVVTTDGKTTTARLYDGKTVLKSAEAKCSPEDTFDFEVGAGLAVDRLLGRKTEEPAPELFPLEDIKAGYLLKVKDDGDPDPYYMTVLPYTGGDLACISINGEYWPLDCFDNSLRYMDTAIVAVYGETIPGSMLDNTPEDRELLWSRE